MTAQQLLSELLEHAPDGELTMRLSEGFAHYDLHPERYVEAAHAVSEPGPWIVIGLRSIGTLLGAVVAEALAAELFVTLRPDGPPFARSPRIAPRLARVLAR